MMWAATRIKARLNVFTRSGGVWTQQQQLTGAGGAAPLTASVFSVALSKRRQIRPSWGHLDNVGARIAIRARRLYHPHRKRLDPATAALRRQAGAPATVWRVSGPFQRWQHGRLWAPYTDDVGANVDQGSATVFTRVGGAFGRSNSSLRHRRARQATSSGISVALTSDGNTRHRRGRTDDIGANGGSGISHGLPRAGAFGRSSSNLLPATARRGEALETGGAQRRWPIRYS